MGSVIERPVVASAAGTDRARRCERPDDGGVAPAHQGGEGNVNGQRPQLPRRLDLPQASTGGLIGLRHGARFGHTPDQVRSARRWGRFVTGLPPEEAHELALIISELHTNAIHHSASGEGGTVDIVLERTAGRITITVTDDGPRSDRPATVPHLPETAPGPDEDHGRGLWLIDQASRQWGVAAVGGRTSVWAEIDRAHQR